MSTNYINRITDTAGTTHDIMEGVDTRIFRATCSTSASTAAKVATLEDSTNYSLATGVRVAVTFLYGNSATTPTLRVDGSSTGTVKTIVNNLNRLGENVNANGNDAIGQYEPWRSADGDTLTRKVEGEDTYYYYQPIDLKLL